jgi:hypothetical protein
MDFLPINLECNLCNFKCKNKRDYERHIITKKHLNTSFIKNNTKMNVCKICNKEYRNRSGLWKHYRKIHFKEELDIYDRDIKYDLVNKETNNIQEKEEKNINLLNNESSIVKNDKNEDIFDLIKYLMKENNDFKNLLFDQQNKMFGLAMELTKNTNNFKNSIMNNNNNNNNNSNNKTFNLQFFLNETCKNAMNITDFMDTINLQLNDLIDVGEMGYIKGISNIIIKKLNDLDITERPIHCTDKKREVLYVKDKGKWEKEDDEKLNLRKVIKHVSFKNMRLLPQFREKYPEYRNSYSLISDQYNKLVMEAMGGKGDNNKEKENKIIKNILKATTIDKNDYK